MKHFFYSFAFAGLVLIQTPFSIASDCKIEKDPEKPFVKIEAKSADFFSSIECLGEAHASFRLKQILWLRQVGQGKASESVGMQGLKMDLFLRSIELEKRAEKLTRDLSESTKQTLSAYAKGVNRILSSRLPKESAWRSEDSILLLLLQSVDQTKKGFETDLKEEKWAAKYGDGASALFSFDDLPWDVPILKDGDYEVAEEKEAKNKTKLGTTRASQLGSLFEPEETGSNNWVIAPSHSKSRNAWFSNDPHLGLKTPSFWLPVSITLKGEPIFGGSLPGVPIVPSGFNTKLAWGLTNSYLDNADLIDIPESQVHTRKERPTVWIKWLGIKLPFIFKSYEVTDQGYPVFLLDGRKRTKRVLKWTLFELTGKDVDSFFEIMFAKSAKEMDEKLSLIGLPSWNFVFSDVGGNIGYRAIGRIPKRTSPEYFGVREGSATDLKPCEILSSEEMPHRMNPKQGFIVTANQKHFPKDAKFSAGRAYAHSFRGFRIEELLRETKKHDFDTIKDILCDVQAVDSRFLAPRMIAVLSKDEKDAELKAFRELLAKWKGDAVENCEVCSAYRKFIDRLKEKEEIEEPALYRLLGELENESADSDRVKSFLKEAKAAWNDVGGTAKSLPKPWGFFHYVSFQWFWKVGEKGPFEIATAGDDHTVSPGTGKWKDGRLEQIWGASWRLVVEMSNPPRAHWVLPSRAGEDDELNAFDRNSPWMKWKRCEFYE